MSICWNKYHVRIIFLKDVVAFWPWIKAMHFAAETFCNISIKAPLVADTATELSLCLWMHIITFAYPYRSACMLLNYWCTCTRICSLFMHTDADVWILMHTCICALTSVCMYASVIQYPYICISVHKHIRVHVHRLYWTPARMYITIHVHQCMCINMHMVYLEPSTKT